MGQLEIPGDWSAYQRSGGSTSVSAPSNENLTSPFGGVADIWLNKAGSLKAGSWKAMDHYKGNGFQTGELANVQTDGGEMYHFLLTRDDEPDISREVYGIVIDDQIYEIKWTILNNEIDLVDAQMQIADVMKTFVAQPK